MSRTRIAIIGTGIAGNVAAYELAREYDISVFEAGSHIGGHTNTITIDDAGEKRDIDTGFIVFNDRTYPNFIDLLDELGVKSQDSSMSFSVRNPSQSLEYNGSTLNTLFAQRRNLFRPSFHRMIRDILRFNNEARDLLANKDLSKTLGEYVRERGYSAEFAQNYLIPMGAAIWSAKPEAMEQIPVVFFARFFHNHGLLDLKNRPQWRVIRGGSHAYVRKLVAGHRHRIHTNAPVDIVTRYPDRVVVKVRDAEPMPFDHVVFACHSDQALRLIANPLPIERSVLGAISYQPNDAVLHTDQSVMPRSKLAWAAWNYHMPTEGDDKVSVTYHMNRLQGIDSDTQYFVTLNNNEELDPAKVICRVDYEHPVFNTASVAAQASQSRINGLKRSWYCGAYWRYGFHEDGVVSAINMLRDFAARNDNEQRDFQRAG